MTLLLFIAVLGLCAPAASLAQSARAARVIDVDAAQRAKQREHSFQAQKLPLLPFQLLDRGIYKGLLAVDRRHLVDKARYYLAEHERGFRPLLGGLGIGTGFTLGVEYYRNDFLRPGGRLGIPLRASSLLYQEYGLTVSMPVDSGRRIFLDATATTASAPATTSSAWATTPGWATGPATCCNRAKPSSGRASSWAGACVW